MDIKRFEHFLNARIPLAEVVKIESLHYPDESGREFNLIGVIAPVPDNLRLFQSVVVIFVGDMLAGSLSAMAEPQKKDIALRVSKAMITKTIVEILPQQYKTLAENADSNSRALDAIMENLRGNRPQGKGWLN